MKKIPSLFKRDYEGTRLIYDEIVPGSEWVVKGEGVATRKYDGTCCLIKEGALFKRYELKPGKTAPEDFEPASDVDEATGKQQGWVPVGEGKEDFWHREAYDNFMLMVLNDLEPKSFDGTYELVGPKIQKNPEGFERHILIPHQNAEVLPGCPRTFNELKAWLADKNIEGVVWHHPDGRMVKIKKKDFGLNREAIILHDSPEAAQYKEDLKGWVSTNGHAIAIDARTDSQAAELLARSMSATHKKCSNCGEVVKANSYCSPCHEKAKLKRFYELEAVDWDGDSILYSDAYDIYFPDVESLEDHLVDTEMTVDEFRLLVCEKAFLSQIEHAHWYDELPEEVDELPQEVIDAVDVLNAVIARQDEIAWYPSKKRASSESVRLFLNAEGT